MLVKHLAVLCLALLVAPAVIADVAPQHLVRLAESFRLAERLGPRVWPGFAAADTPILLIDGEREYLLNNSGAAPGFTTTAQTFRGRPVLERPRVFPPGLQASFPLIDRPAVVIGTPEATGTAPAVWTIVVLHEMFHVFAFSRGEVDKVASLGIGPRLDAQWQLSYPFPYDDARVQRAMHIAGRDLYRCIESGEDLPYEANVADEALRTFADLLDLAAPGKKDYAYAKFVSTKEGVARYFEYRIAELAARDYRPSAEYAKLDGADAFVRAWKSYYQAMPFQIKHLGNVSRSRNEFYNLGMGIALVLDRISPDWQRHYFEQGVWIDDLLHDAAPAVKAANTRRGERRYF
jgi:hypothetical protein